MPPLALLERRKTRVEPVRLSLSQLQLLNREFRPERFEEVFRAVCKREGVTAGTQSSIKDEVFSRIGAKAQKIAGAFGGRSSWNTYYFSCVRNEVRSLLSVSAYKRTKPFSAMHPQSERGNSFLEGLLQTRADPRGEEARREKIEAVQEALSRLAPHQQTLLRRKYFDGKEDHELALELGIPVGTVKSRSHRARRELEEMLLRDPRISAHKVA